MARASKGGPPLKLLKKEQHKIRWAFYGYPRSGKTHLAATSCFIDDLSPVCFLSFGTGEDTVLQNPNFNDKIDVYSIEHPVDVIDMFNWLEEIPEAPERGEPYKTIILDDFGELHKMYMRDYLKVQAKNDPNKRSEYAAFMNDWGYVRNWYLDVFDWFRVSDYHLLFTFWSSEAIDDGDNRKKEQIALPGQLKSDIGGNIDLFRCELDIPRKNPEDTSYIVYSQGTAKFVAGIRTRTGVFPDEMVNPTMETLYNYYLEAKGE